jgi:hypothetical protein
MGALVMATGAFCVLNCLDVAVIHVEPRSSDAGSDSSLEADSDVTVDAGPRPCEVCLRAPDLPGYGCGNELAACSADAQCSGTIECAIAQQCFELSGQGAIIDCGTPCARDAGLDVTGPSGLLVLAVVTCAQDACGPTCRGEVGDAAADTTGQ